MILLYRRLATVAAFALAGTLSTLAHAEMKIAVVDTQRAVMETEDGLRAQASLKKHFDKRQRDLDDKQTSLQKEREDIEKQKDVLSKAALQAQGDMWLPVAGRRFDLIVANLPHF